MKNKTDSAPALRCEAMVRRSIDSETQDVPLEVYSSDVQQDAKIINLSSARDLDNTKAIKMLWITLNQPNNAVSNFEANTPEKK